jgi:hypothetical protein
MPIRLAPILFGLIMSQPVSGGANRRKADLGDRYLGIWIKAWLPSWRIARLVGLLVKPPAKLVR